MNGSISLLNIFGLSIIGAWQHLSINFKVELGIRLLNWCATEGGVIVSLSPQTNNVGHFILYNFLARLFLWADLAIVIIFRHLALSLSVLNISSTYFIESILGL